VAAVRDGGRGDRWLGDAGEPGRAGVGLLMRAAGLVFAGVVRDLDRPAAAGSGDPVVVTFAVSEVYKGEVSATMRVLTPADGAVCGYQFVEGNRYLVHARIEEQQRRLDGETTPAGPSMRESGQRNVASVIVARKNSPVAHSSVPKK
jgi:hypothetical protein